MNRLRQLKSWINDHPEALIIAGTVVVLGGVVFLAKEYSNSIELAEDSKLELSSHQEPTLTQMVIDGVEREVSSISDIGNNEDLYMFVIERD